MNSLFFCILSWLCQDGGVSGASFAPLVYIHMSNLVLLIWDTDTVLLIWKRYWYSESEEFSSEYQMFLLSPSAIHTFIFMIIEEIKDIVNLVKYYSAKETKNT